MAITSTDTLVKYCTASTAQEILSTQTLRWSAPCLFSDPFELSHESQISFTPHTLLQSLIQTCSAMIFSRDNPVGNTPLIAAIRRWRDEARFDTPEEAEEVLRDLMSRMVDQRQESIDEIMTEWRKFSRTLRVCCFIDRHDNINAWRQYAHNHQGVAIRFRYGEGTALPDPKEVSYQDTRPEIITLKEQLGILMYNNQSIAEEHFYEKFSTKSKLSKDEKEWRSFAQATEELQARQSNEEQWFDDRAFNSNEVHSIYLGVDIDNKEKRKIYDIIKAKCPKAKIFQASASLQKYELTFERITE